MKPEIVYVIANIRLGGAIGGIYCAATTREIAEAILKQDTEDGLIHDGCIIKIKIYDSVEDV